MTDLSPSTALIVLAFMVLLSLVPGAPRSVGSPDPDEGRSLKGHLDATLRHRLIVANLDGLVTEPALSWCGLLLSLSATGWILANLGGAIAGGLAALLGPLLVARLWGDQTERRLEVALPDVLEATARNLRTGSSLLPSLSRSLHSAERSENDLLSADIALMLRANEGGVALGACLDEWAERRPYQSVRKVVSTIHVGLATGAELAEPLERAAEGLRIEASLRSEIAALAAQAKASVLVIGLAPLAFLGVAAASGTSVQMLFGSPVGALAMVCGLGLDVLGVVWMQRIIRGVAQ